MALGCKSFMTKWMHLKGYSASISASSCTIFTPNNACSASTSNAAGTTGSIGNYGTSGVTDTNGTTCKN